ncbi:MAG: sensor histidine kinase N-terminal domain-containing protein [Rhodoferax sp.]|uniref:sensor histidine kinase N-terminal domain-containing protein n=1 Tax=Rhodoferax sp. TaxID=50421 RepID=UPI00272048B9|nr:sensor histidine kinase N-terminal domain-containing protein [Rhodoferax sp.]MDO9143729.1 sensor histidine kinase N-terminal domain-containing protein [Rhodoferax sp.]MDP1529588.1 sensor histidine kinase N-terminal domain-containing protein [Rhodoferax sp.]MDP1944931.1 sensor histidine kinase N-terminal domain-containing protein [Rhodoferax sp.]MDP3191883.1 sensor histidine kinase N-terminal domain-containing protein [Rhodoferax sp.]MDP3335774.1 sensor histidine kinase N-terminal domain-con
MKKWLRQLSLRSYLMLGILLPVALFILVDSVVIYRQALIAVNTAYDRTLLASAKALGEHIEADGEADAAQLRAVVPYAALEVFEADNRSRMIYRISDTQGRLIDGFKDLALWRGQLPALGPYAALVDFYDDNYRGDAVRVAVLLQPVAMKRARTMAVVQVAETLELRRTLARQIMFDTLWRQLALVSVIALVVFVVVQRATRPVRNLSLQLQQRRADDLTPLSLDNAPHELRPLLDATNTTMRRLQHLLENQKRFVRDTAHQLRTPLAVLKVQVQSALRGDVDAHQGLLEISHTVERATQLANQMLALAKVAQLAQEKATEAVDWAGVVREVALDLSPLIADKALDFDIDTVPAPIQTHAWMLRELSRNLLHNAIRYSPEHGKLQVRLLCDASHAALVISDNGPGISEELRKRLFQPFSAGQAHSGSGLGLAICLEISHTLGGQIELVNRLNHGRIEGLDTTVRLPLAIMATGTAAKP